MTASELIRINYAARGGRPCSLYMDEETLALLAQVQTAHNLRNRSATIRYLAAAWSEERRTAEA